MGNCKVQGVIGDYGVPGMNESGEWMVDWCMQYEMTVCNTLFKKRDVHKYTWVRQVRGEIVESALMHYMCISGKYKARHVPELVSLGGARNFLPTGKICSFLPTDCKLPIFSIHANIMGMKYD